MRISHRNDSSAFWLVLVASSVLLHGLLLVLAAHLAGLFSVQTKTQTELTPIEMVELPTDPVLENLTNEVAEASPAAPAPVAPAAPSPPVELATPQVLPPLPPQPVAPVTLPSPTPSFSPTAPEPTPIPTSIPASPIPTPVPTPPASPIPSPSAVSPSPLPTPAEPIPESPPTANVQSIEESLPTVLPGSEAPTENPSTADPNLAPIAVDPEAIPAQVRMTVAIADSPALSASPAAQQWVFEPNPMTSSCPAMTPSVVRQFGMLVTLQVELGANGQVLRTIPINVNQDAADSTDYINFVQCVLTERWQTDPSTLAVSPPEGGLVVVDVMVEASNPTQ